MTGRTITRNEVRQLQLTWPLRQCTLTPMNEATELADATASKDPEVGLAAVTALRELLESLESLQAAHARERGGSWQQIAAELGVSKQAVHKKHGSRRVLVGRRER